MKKYNLDIFKILLLLLNFGYIYITSTLLVYLNLGQALVAFFVISLIAALLFSAIKKDISYLFGQLLLYFVVTEIILIYYTNVVLGTRNYIFSQNDINNASGILNWLIIYSLPFFILMNSLILFAKKPKK